MLPIENPQAPPLPVTVTDFQGTEVTVNSAERILALDMYGTRAQTVVALGLGDNLADLPLVTQNGHDISAEAVLSLAPTVVLMDTTNGPLEITEQLRSAGRRAGGGARTPAAGLHSRAAQRSLRPPH